MAKTVLWVTVLCAVVAGTVTWTSTCLQRGQAIGQAVGRAGDLIAVAVRDNREYPTLFVIDVKERHLSAYQVEASGTKLRMVGARNIDWDLQIPNEYPVTWWYQLR